MLGRDKAENEWEVKKGGTELSDFGRKQLGGKRMNTIQRRNTKEWARP